MTTCRGQFAYGSNFVGENLSVTFLVLVGLLIVGASMCQKEVVTTSKYFHIFI